MNAQVPVGSIARAKCVIEALSDFPQGASLSQIIARTDFTKSTTHRVLASLQDVNFVFQDPVSRKYFMGSSLAQLARTANQSDLSALAHRSMARLADASEDTIFLSAPEGNSSICVRIELGDFPIRTLTQDPGDRLPLGVGATSQAIYAMMPDTQRQAVVRANANWMKEHNSSPRLAEDLRRDFQKRGYAYNPSLVIPGMSAVALPIVSAKGQIVAGLGIGAINERMSTKRIESELIPMLQTETGRFCDRIDALDAEGLL